MSIWPVIETNTINSHKGFFLILLWYIYNICIKYVNIFNFTFKCIIFIINCCCSVTKSCPTLQSHWLQHARLPCSSLSLKACSNSGPLSQWCYPHCIKIYYIASLPTTVIQFILHWTISSSALSSPFAFNLSQHQGLFQWVCLHIRWPSIGGSASAAVLPMNI